MTVNPEKPTDTITAAAPSYIDGTSYAAAELNRLEGRIPVVTEVGRSTLHADMAAGTLTPAQVAARQGAVSELAGNTELREVVTASLQQYASHEQGFLRFASAGEVSTRTYAHMRGGASAMTSLQKDLQHFSNQAETSELAQALQLLADFNDTNTASLMRGPVVLTPLGMRGREQAGFWPRLRFRPGLSGRLAVTSVGLFLGAKYGIVPPIASEGATLASAMVGGYGNIPNSSGLTMKSAMFNNPLVYKRIRGKIVKTPEYPLAISTIGRIDTMVGLAGLKGAMEGNGHPTTFPEIDDAEEYTFEASQIKNPLLTLGPGRLVVPNDVRLGGPDRRLTFLTGPNSGGKSTLSKLIIQSQVLAQIGAAIPASSAHMSRADRIAYHTPLPPDLADESGRFGFELGRVRSILDAASDKSLTLLDDCLDGTTHEERVAVLRNVMILFRHIGGTTLFSTHAHELVAEFEDHDEGQFWQVEFADGHPTYRLKSGVSTTSHANEVAGKHGFTQQQVAQTLREAGKELPDWL
jgi:DNA mismatch repair protein MutS